MADEHASREGFNAASRGFFTLFEKQADTGRNIMYRTIEGKGALLLFRSTELAQRFIDGMGYAGKWRIHEMTLEGAAEWLRRGFKNQGATEVAIDPDPQQRDSVRVAPIVAILIEIEGTGL
jgi:hypothetical protein